MKRDRHDGFVYFIGSEPAGVVKIGVARGIVETRLKGLQTGCPFPLKIFGYVRGYTDLEQRLHRTFRPLWRHGEWFELRDKLLHFIYYIEGYAETNDSLLINDVDFDASVHDCVWAGMCYPGMDEEQYEASADRSEWAGEYE